MQQVDKTGISCPYEACAMYGEEGEWNIQTSGLEWFCDACGRVFRAPRATRAELPEGAYPKLVEAAQFPTITRAACVLGVGAKRLSTWLWVARCHWEETRKGLQAAWCSAEEIERVQKFALGRREGKY